MAELPAGDLISLTQYPRDLRRLNCLAAMGPGNVACDVDRVAQGKASLTRKADAKRFALDVRHHIVEQTSRFARGKDDNSLDL